MGPTFGIKGGAAGGGYSQVVPMERLNLHLTGDFHAVTAAHNLLAAMVDNHLHHGNELGIDVRNITWRRVLDVNDRALRNVVIGLGARKDGVPRETGFDITAASEVMVISALATSLRDLRERLGRIVVGYTTDGQDRHRRGPAAAGAMAVILRDAIKPNLLQTLERRPALIHCRAVRQHRHGQRRPSSADLHRHARQRLRSSPRPASAPTWAPSGSSTSSAGSAGSSRTSARRRGHGARAEDPLGALPRRGRQAAARRACSRRAPTTSRPALPNLRQAHRDRPALRRAARRRDQRLPRRPRLRARGHPALAATSSGCAFGGDPPRRRGRGRVRSSWPQVVVEAAHEPTAFEFLYALDLPLEREDRDHRHARSTAPTASTSAPRRREALRTTSGSGYGGLPVVIAKTHLSISSDPTLRGAPRGWRMPVREVRAAAGAGYVYAICGDMRTMPGLPSSPNAERIDIAEDGRVTGLS